jgi:class 3 adenylate cyclase
LELHRLHPDSPGPGVVNQPDQSPASPVERKLVTILSADVAEYSRLMAEDEEHTLRIFRDHSQTFRALIDLYHGRIFNTAGDAILAEFTSPVEAVRCATEIQAALRTRNEQLPLTRQVKFRIGVNLGDVMVQNSDLLGDGVNVAARLQGTAAPGGICISGSVYDQIRNKLTLGFESLGERRFKNIPQPVRTFTIAGTDEQDETAPKTKPLGRPKALVKYTIAALSLLVLAAAYWSYSMHRSSQTGAAPKVAGQVAARPSAADVSRDLTMQSNALLADAQRLHRPSREIQALADSNTQIVALALQLHELEKNPGETAKTDSLTAQMKDLAANMSRGEATALGRVSKTLWRDMEQPPSKIVAADASAAIAAASQAKTRLDDAIAAANALDATASLKETRQALAAYDAFTTAYGAAAQFYIVARRSDFSVLAAAAHGASDQLVAFGKVSKPWVLASRARRDAYKTLADNGSEAAALLTQLDELERGAASANDLRKISGALAQAETIKERLGAVLASSNAAYRVYNQ